MHSSLSRENIVTHKLNNMLHSIDLSNEEWCQLHWNRIKDAIATGITSEEIEKIYDNIVYLRNNKCDSLTEYRKYLGKRDEYLEIKKRIEALLISD